MTSRADLYRQAFVEHARLVQRLNIAIEALEFYADGDHFDTVHFEGDPEEIKRTRILDTGSVAEEALKEIFYVPYA